MHDSTFRVCAFEARSALMARFAHLSRHLTPNQRARLLWTFGGGL